MTSDPAATPPPCASNKFTGAIVAGSIGVFVLLALVLVAAIVYLVRRRRRQAMVRQFDVEQPLEVRRSHDPVEVQSASNDMTARSPTIPPVAQPADPAIVATGRVQEGDTSGVEGASQSLTEPIVQLLEHSTSRESIKVDIPLYLIPPRSTVDSTTPIDITPHTRQASDATLVNPPPRQGVVGRTPSGSEDKASRRSQSDMDIARLRIRKRSATIPAGSGNSQTGPARRPLPPRPSETTPISPSSSFPPYASTSGAPLQSSGSTPPVPPERARRRSLRRKRALPILPMEPVMETSDSGSVQSPAPVATGGRNSVDTWFRQIFLQLHTPPVTPSVVSTAPPGPQSPTSPARPEVILWGPDRRPTLPRVKTSIRRTPPPQSPIQPYHLEPPPPPPKDPPRAQEANVPARPSTAPTRGSKNGEESSEQSFGSSNATHGSNRTMPQGEP